MKHVLLIDDSEMDIYISKHIIENRKFAEKISVSISAIEALVFLNSLKGNHEEFPDVIFLDIRMPVMDGFEFLEEFSKFPESFINKTAVYMLTSSADSNDKERAAKFTVAKKFITKPLSPSILNEIALA